MNSYPVLDMNKLARSDAGARLLADALSLIHRISKEAAIVKSLAADAGSAVEVPSGTARDRVQSILEIASNVCREATCFNRRAAITIEPRRPVGEMFERISIAMEREFPDAVLEFRIGRDDRDVTLVETLEEVICGLVENGLAAGASVSTVVVEFVQSPDEYRISVEDDGDGMSEAVLATCTKPGYSTRIGMGGSGLGLPLAKAAVSAAGGALEIDSVPGVGTKVLLRIPRVESV